MTRNKIRFCKYSPDNHETLNQDRASNVVRNDGVYQKLMVISCEKTQFMVVMN